MREEAPPRLRRSVLFTPGTRADRFEKAVTRRSADVVVADLEDAVGPDEKDEARAAVAAALQTTAGAGAERWVRINTWRSAWTKADLAAVVAARPDAIVIPKAAAHAELVALDMTLQRLERRAGLAPGRTPIVPILETAAGVLHAVDVVRAPRVVAVAFGAEDLAADAGLQRTAAGEEVAMARAHVALAAGAARVDAIDQVFVHIADVDGLAKEARIARTLGYRGKMLIHPDQVAPVHAVFAPSEAEIEAAARLVAAVDGAKVGAGGVLRFEGRMVDMPLIEQARRVLAEARAAGRTA